jgi:hypothetical protein
MGPLNVLRCEIPDDPAPPRLIHRFLQIQKTAQDSFNICVDNRSRQVESKTRDRTGGVSPDAGKLYQGVDGGGKLSVPLGQNNLCAFVQISGTVVVTEPLPGVEDFGFIGICQFG